MNKKQFMKIITEVVRKEVKKEVKKIFIKEETSNNLVDIIPEVLEPKEEIQYTKNKSLNDVLNETVGLSKSQKESADYPTLGGEAFFAGNPYSLLVSLGGVIQEPIASFTIVENQINFASAPRAGADFFIVVLATTNVDPLKTLTIGTRSTAHSMDLHGRSMVVRDRSGTNHPIAFNLA